MRRTPCIAVGGFAALRIWRASCGYAGAICPCQISDIFIGRPISKAFLYTREPPSVPLAKGGGAASAVTGDSP